MPDIPPNEHDRGVVSPVPPRARAASGPVMIEVRDVHKTFRIPKHRVDTLKERVAHPFAEAEYTELQALRGISFDVHRGEFFGIVGRNGSGKSTLLKILSSIYRADAGTIRMAGRLAPFIELGVGFNPELTARENVALNGVLMGLGRREARRRLDAVLDFAELRDFTDLKLKNYSSGMMVRLAFAAMVEADADIMLVDEVLAVGDAAFAQKCMQVFRDKRKAGKTLVLVTHDMATVQGFCDRAMLIHDGRVAHLGDPEETAMDYIRLNFSGPGGHDARAASGAIPDVNVKVVDVWLEDEAGARVENVEQGRPIGFGMVVEARYDMEEPVFTFHVMNADGVWMFRFTKRLAVEPGAPDRIAAGQRVRIGGRIDNPLAPGSYSMDCWISRRREQGDLGLHVLKIMSFLVYGTAPRAGNILVETEVAAELVSGAPA
jgi:ABC-type polysaccharide/polyol phosphate transport system ATPase subunit